MRNANTHLKKKRENAQINLIRKQKGDITTELSGIDRA